MASGTSRSFRTIRYIGNWPMPPRGGPRSLTSIFAPTVIWRSEEHTSELQSLMRISYAVFCLKKKRGGSTNSNGDGVVGKLITVNQDTRQRELNSDCSY